MRTARCVRAHLIQPSDHHRWGPVGLMPDLELRTTKRIYWGSGKKCQGGRKDCMNFLPQKKDISNSSTAPEGKDLRSQRSNSQRECNKPEGIVNSSKQRVNSLRNITRLNSIN
ncbi:hypothetical protein SFRURICE_019922 [Spodoptera frugiperda]|nr:hypothetical protein SFRURICE_019922 [Spodoptera frugiperda]